MKHFRKQLARLSALCLAAACTLSVSVSAAASSSSDISDLLDKVTTMTAVGRENAEKSAGKETSVSSNANAAPGIVTGGAILLLSLLMA